MQGRCLDVGLRLPPPATQEDESAAPLGGGCVLGVHRLDRREIGDDDFEPQVFKGAARFIKNREYSKPYWATEGPGNTCWMSMSGSDLVTVISFRTERVVAEVKVGDHPQRVREGHVRESIIDRF